MKSLISVFIVFFMLCCVVEIIVMNETKSFAVKNNLKYVVVAKGTFFNEYYPTDTFTLFNGCIVFIDKTDNTKVVISPSFYVEQPQK